MPRANTNLENFSLINTNYFGLMQFGVVVSTFQVRLFYQQSLVEHCRCTRLRCPRLDCPPVTVMTHVKALQAGHSSQGTSEPITPVCLVLWSYTFMIRNSTISITPCYITDYICRMTQVSTRHLALVNTVAM